MVVSQLGSFVFLRALLLCGWVFLRIERERKRLHLPMNAGFLRMILVCGHRREEGCVGWGGLGGVY